MQLEQALGVAPPDLFNPVGLADCLSNMATTGCYLHPRDRTSLFQAKAGIPYSVKLDFSKSNQLYIISLGYDGLDKITGDQCLEIYERSLDWVAAEYGTLVNNNRLKAENFEDHVTPGGHRHRIALNPSGDFVGSMERRFSGNRIVSPIVYYIEGRGEPSCWVDVEFRDDSIEPRPPPIVE
jgi:hypothetical protein